ncbi:MAG: hypothetical protein ACQCN5_12200 [Candidatus Bathyarchaeia archaeon]|jgi:hypothetical protein
MATVTWGYLKEEKMMKHLIKKCSIPLLVLLMLTCLSAVSLVNADQSASEDQVRDFIENVLPIDSAKCSITQSANSTVENVSTLKYTLVSNEESCSIIFQTENNILEYCKVSGNNFDVISDKQPTSLLDAVRSFLEKYGAYSKTESAGLIEMLNGVDLTKDTTSIVGNTKLTITNKVSFGKDLTYFKWAHTVNEVDYTSLQVSFQKNGIFNYLRDDRAIYAIGDTSINISKEQAVELALKAAESYSYEMPGDYWVSGFNVTEEYISAKLDTTPENYVLRPYWDIRMPLNQTYPGSVQGLTVFLWANTGEVISVGNMAYGGIQYPDDSNIETVPYSTDAASVEPSITQNKPISDLLVPLGIVTIIIAVILVSTVAVKKRK